MDGQRQLALRVAFGVVAIVALFALRWDSTIQHFDFQVWEASNVLLGEGRNPYDDVILNGELQSDTTEYGPFFDDGLRYMFFNNPPTWIVTLRLLGFTPFSMSLVGAIALMGSVIWLTRERATDAAIAAMTATGVFFFLGPGISTFRFGQTGMFLAGLVGLHLALLGSRFSGLGAALASFKPHIAFSLGLAQFVRRPRSEAIRLLVPFAVLVSMSVALFGAGLWQQWIDAVSGTPVPGTLELSLSSLSASLPWRSLGVVGIVITAGVSSMLALRYRAVNPQLVSLVTLSVITFGSGYAFVHDWLWLPLIPIVLGWSPKSTLLSVTAVAFGLSLPETWAFDAIVRPHPAIALAITLGLIYKAEQERKARHQLEVAPPTKPLAAKPL